MKKILVYTLTTVLVVFATAQLSIMALNNVSHGQRTYQMGKYLITQRWASDQDPPPGADPVLSSYARSDVFTAPDILDEEGNVIEKSECGWRSYASTSYNGANENYNSNYHVKVKILTFEREDKRDFIGLLSASESLSINMKPIPDNTTAEIDDCEALGKANGQDPSDKSKHSTESNI